MSEAQDTTERPRRGRPPNPDGALLKQNVRVSKQQWDKMADATRGEGSNTSEVTRELYAWYLGEPGAKLPRRPLARQQSMDLARVAAAAVASRDTGTTESPQGPPCTCTRTSDTGHDTECPRADWARGNRGGS